MKYITAIHYFMLKEKSFIQFYLYYVCIPFLMLEIMCKLLLNVHKCAQMWTNVQMERESFLQKFATKSNFIYYCSLKS